MLLVAGTTNGSLIFNQNKFLKKKFITRPLSQILMVSVFTLGVCNASAKGQESESGEDNSIVTYEKDFFEKYSPVTLLEMLQRIPGVPDILNKNRQQRGGGGGGGGANNRGERGFGSGGDQILINGKRLAGKSNNIDDTLGRISASQVSKVELIRGASSGLDVQSQGLVINVILNEGASNSTTFWQTKNEYKFGHALGAEFLVSHSGSTGNFEYMFSGERTSNNFIVDRLETTFDPSEIQTGTKHIDAGFHFRGFKLNTNLAYNFEDGAILRLNGLFEPQDMNGDEFRIERGNSPEDIFWETNENKDKWEVGGDYSRSLGTIGNLKALFVVNQQKEDKIVDRFIGAGAAQFENTQDSEFENKREKILRASVTHNLTPSQSIEIGGEAAINTFDKKFEVIDRDFAIDPFTLESSDNVEIKENRYEVFANHNYNISSSLVLQSSLTAEFSKIVADNIFDDGSFSRRDTSFTYLKPRLNLRYDLTERDQLRFIIEKKVSQLDFSNFVTRFDQRTEELKIGNTNIRPEQVWEFSATYEHRLPNDTGSVEGEVFYRNYKDHITRVDFSEYQNLVGNDLGLEEFFALSSAEISSIRDMDLVDFTSKSGNIDKATAYGAKFRGNIRLGFINLPQATFSVSYTYEKRRGIDQFTGLKTNFDQVSDHTVDINFRHDVTKWDFSYGFRGSFRSDEVTNDINYNWPNSPAAFLSVFAEYNIFSWVKMRIEGKQLTGKRGTSNIFWYNDHIRLNDFDKRVNRVSVSPREIELTLQGTF
jgi:hypothetical protein